VSNKPRGLGNTARQLVENMDHLLVHSWNELQEQYDGEPMLNAEHQLIAARVRADIAEVRRMIAELQALRSA
jgi:hypothetical protein